MNAEVIIVGGGIIGCAAAYNLAKNGVSVLVLEGSAFGGQITASPLGENWPAAFASPAVTPENCRW